jgi:hypothetical protein
VPLAVRTWCSLRLPVPVCEGGEGEEGPNCYRYALGTGRPHQASSSSCNLKQSRCTDSYLWLTLMKLATEAFASMRSRRSSLEFPRERPGNLLVRM